MSEEVKTGIKISAEELKKLDRNNMRVMVSGKAKEGEVEAQGYVCISWCCYCGTPLRAICSHDTSNYYICGACGGAFRL